MDVLDGWALLQSSSADCDDSYYPEQYYHVDPSSVVKNDVIMSYIPNNATTSAYVPAITTAGMYSGSGGVQQQALKRKMTLDLNNAKRARGGFGTPDVITTPDVLKLSLPSPDMEKFLRNQSSLQTPTPATSGLATFYQAPTTVSAEREQFIKGFEVALNDVRARDSANASSNSFEDDNSSSSYGGSATHHFGEFGNVVVKEEPQTVPEDDEDDEDDHSLSSEDHTSLGDGISPIDMESQEKIKLERKRQRNRLAASKCRKRKLEKIANLEDKVKRLKGENNDLANVLVKLRETVNVLRAQVNEHVQAGCPIMVNVGGVSGSASY